MDLGSISGGFWDNFGSSWAPNSKKRRSGNLSEKLWKKSAARLSDESVQGGGGGPLNHYTTLSPRGLT